MPDAVVQGLATLTRVLEIAGAGALVLGFVITTVRWVRRSLQQGAAPALAPYRRGLGRWAHAVHRLHPERARAVFGAFPPDVAAALEAGEAAERTWNLLP